MVSPVRLDAIVDLAYGALIALSIVLIATLDTRIGVAFGVGVFAAYVLHVVWKMARFDPDWMTRIVEETVEETVEHTVEDRLDEVQARVDAVDERVDRRPRKDEVEEIVDETAASGRAGKADDG